MRLPKKENPRKYTVVTKVNKDTYLALKQLANEESEGNLSRWLAEYLQADPYVKYHPELDDPEFVANL